MAKTAASTYPAAESKSLWLLLAAGLVLRILLTPYLTYSLDLYTYVVWSDSLRETGFSNFFTSNWVDYLPGYPYILYLLASIKEYFSIASDDGIRLLYKSPAIIADVITGLLIYKLVAIHIRKKVKLFGQQISLALLATAAYLFNPAIFANSSLWGQTDSFTALFAVGSLYFAYQGMPLLAGISLGLGSLVKLNTLIILPILLILWLKDKAMRKIVTLLATATLIFIASFIPFQNKSPLLPFIVDRVQITANQYPYTSLNALNLWFLLHGSWHKDTGALAGVSYHTWGNLLFIAIIVFIVALSLRRSKGLPALTAAAAVAFFAAFLLLTRMHERHLFAALPFLLLTAVFTHRWRWYIGVSLVYLANLIFGFEFGPGNPKLLTLPSWFPKLVSILSIGIFLAFIRDVVRRKKENQAVPTGDDLPAQAGSKNNSLKSHNAKKSNAFILLQFTTPFSLSKHTFSRVSFRLISSKTILIACIISIAFVVRLVRLGEPPSFYFDEVYHAFTAQEMLKGNPKAWEWWHTPPEGVAYEWTHPPLAKQFMVLSMTIFGQSAFGWRFFGVIFGTANILLVYLLAKELFPPKSSKLKAKSSLPLLAAGLYAVESLTFVQSRIAMNDTYMLFFILLTFLLTLKQKYPAAAVSLGLALATKWSAIYVAPLLAFLLIIKHKQHLKRYLKPIFLFVSALVAIYLFSYLPFLLNHSWADFIHLQKQMYWYHTRLEATHDYSSPWWSWPLLLRPVWYYVDYGAPSSSSATSAAASGLGNGWISSLLKAADAKVDGENSIANIYALGNPIIFWGGLIAVIYTLIAVSKNLFKKSLEIRNWSLVILLAGYLSFLLPWALSPRIMFLYHYLPSIPFLVILLAWALIKLGNSGKPGSYLTISYMLLAISVFIFFYPHLTGLPVNTSWAQHFFWLKSWK